MANVELPPRRSRQSLNVYVRENLERLEKEVFAGVPYEALVNTALAAGFAKVAVLSLHSAMYRARRLRPERARSPLPEAVLRPTGSPSIFEARSPMTADYQTMLRRRYRELVRTPRPGSDEPDLLV